MIHSFLLIGQSNMAGRGNINEVEPIKSPRLKVLRNGRWQEMYTPVNCDRSFAGINLAESFAEAYVRDHDADVGLIPCADGGTQLDQWREGSLLFDHAVYQARLAQRTSTIAGVLWHQGEGDCADHLYPLYEEKFTKIMNAFRAALGLYDVPFLLGGLGDFLKDCIYDEKLKNYVHVNAALQAIAQKNEMTGFVPADGLTAKPDNLHFSAAALRAFGLRYYDVFRALEKKDKLFEEKPHPDNAVRRGMELL